MPNHVNNTLVIAPVTNEQAQRIIEACEIDRLCEEFLPQPDWSSTPNEDGVFPGPEYFQRHTRRRMWQGGDLRSIGRRFPDGSYDQRWYSWNIDAYGTKWGAYECSAEYNEDAQSVCIFYQTAWSPLGDQWVEVFSQAHPGAEVFITFDEPGMDFFGITLGIDGSSTTHTDEIAGLRLEWLNKNHPDHDPDDYDDDEIEEEWWEECGDKISDAQAAMLKQLRLEFKASSHEVKGTKLVEYLRANYDSVIFGEFTTDEQVKAAIDLGYINYELVHADDSLEKEAQLRAALQRLEHNIMQTHAFVEETVSRSIEQLKK